MNRLKISGPREALARPQTQLEILRQLKAQEGSAERFIKIIELGIEGAVQMSPRGALMPIIDLIKARSAPPRGGEIAVIDELKAPMLDTYHTRADALAQELAAIFELDQLEKGDKPQRFTPPQAAQEAARRGLELRAKHKRGGLSTREAGELGIGSGVQRAVNISRGDSLDLETLKMMRGFFNRHEKNKDNKAKDGSPSAGAIAWLLWGGDPARAWVNKTLKDLEDSRK
jgi:hypothetical protein